MSTGEIINSRLCVSYCKHNSNGRGLHVFSYLSDRSESGPYPKHEDATDYKIIIMT